MRKTFTFLCVALALVLTTVACANTTESSAPVERKAYDTQGSHIIWRNNLPIDVTFSISDYDTNYDGGSRPYYPYPGGIQGYTLHSGNSLNERIEMVDNYDSHVNRFKVTLKDSKDRELVAFGLEYEISQTNNWYIDAYSTFHRERPIWFTYREPSGKQEVARVLRSNQEDGEFTFERFDG